MVQRRKSSRIVCVRDFGWEIAHEAISRRPPISVDTIVARTEGYTHDVGIWDLSIVQGPFSAVLYQSPKVTIRNLCTAVNQVNSRTHVPINKIRCDLKYH
jgi:hypothetical protein